MAARLIIAPEAEADISDAYAWYEAQRSGLGEDLLGAVDACIQAIPRHPDTYAPVYRAYRRGLVRRFPYAVVYEHTENTVTVYAVFHTSRDPQKSRRRLP